jgi:hypothetical protein
MQVTLIDDELGTLELGSDLYVVTSLQIGSPAVRAVTRDRALADGVFDNTRFLGARAVTLAVRLRNDPRCLRSSSGYYVEQQDYVPGYLTPTVGTVSTPDTPDLTISGNVRITAKLRFQPPGPWQQVAAQADQFTAGLWSTYVHPGYFPPGGAAVALYTHDNWPALYPANADTYFGVEFRLNYQGAMWHRALVSNDGGSWTVGGPNPAWAVPEPPTAAFNNSTQPLIVGALGDYATGRIYWVQAEQLDANFNPTGVIWRFDADDYPGTGTSYVDPRGRTWTLAAAGAITPKVPYIPRTFVPPVYAQGDDMQTLIDRVIPYMSPRRRPLLAWQLPGSNETRGMVVRGESWPFTLDGPKYPTIGLQWVCPSGEITGGNLDPLCTLITPGADVELGRAYPEDYADGGRSYPFSGTIGQRLIENPGNGWANWTLTIFGAATGPRFTINGSTIEFDRGGNLVVGAGSSVVLDSRERTILLNNDPANSVYYKTNYDEWSWDELRLRPGTNQIRFDGFSLGPTATAQLCFRPTYLA